MRLTSAKTLVLLTALSVAACSGGADPDPTTTTSSTTSSTSTTGATTTTMAPTADQIVLDVPTEFGPAWSEILTFTYGGPPDHLGTSLGGDGEGVMWGPEYGTQMPDGTWWFLDAANFRLAHFSETGAYLGEVVLPEEYLGSGVYFQYQYPQALSDGSLVMTSTSMSFSGLLVMAPDTSLRRVATSEYVSYKTTDGEYLYGFSESGAMVRVDPASGELTEVPAFTSQTGESFTVSVSSGTVRIVRSGVDLELPVISAADPDETVHPMVEAKMGSDGTLFIFMTGIVERAPGDAYDLVGFVSVGPDGWVSPVEPVSSPFSSSDGGGGPRLGVRLGDNQPHLMFVGNDAIHVYRPGG